MRENYTKKKDRCQNPGKFIPMKAVVIISTVSLYGGSFRGVCFPGLWQVVHAALLITMAWKISRGIRGTFPSVRTNPATVAAARQSASTHT
jgi:hypothetical protein